MTRFVNIIRAWLRSPSHVVVFVPCESLGVRDLVSAAHRLCRSRLTSAYALMLCERCVPHFFDLCRNHGLRPPKRIVLFAHATEDAQGFSANPSLDTGEHYLLLRFWEHQRDQFQLFVAHACFGASILTRPLWKRTFPAWVSYRGELGAFLASSRAEQHWRSLFERMLEEIPRGRTPRGVAARLTAAYAASMAEVYDGYSPEAGDAVNLIYLERSIQALVTSED